MTRTSDRFLLMRIKQRNAQSRMDKLARQLHANLANPNHHADDTKQIERELHLAQARKQAVDDKNKAQEPTPNITTNTDWRSYVPKNRTNR